MTPTTINRSEPGVVEVANDPIKPVYKTLPDDLRALTNDLVRKEVDVLKNLKQYRIARRFTGRDIDEAKKLAALLQEFAARTKGSKAIECLMAALTDDPNADWRGTVSPTGALA